MQRYYKVAQSAELAEYKELQAIVKAADFKEKKKKLVNRKYKDTEFCAKWKTFQKLSRDRGLLHYFKLEKDAEFQEFLKFRESDQFLKMADKAAVKADPYLQKMLKISRSKDCKNYFRFKDSGKLREYLALKEEVESEEFRKQNDFWSNPKRWETTPEYVKDTRYYELSKNHDIVFYESITHEEVEKYERQKVTLDEQFAWNALGDSGWDSGFFYDNEKLLRQHSFVNEQQANNGGKNTRVFDGHLYLSTKREHVNAPAWDLKKGFVSKDFDFTSDVLQNAKSFKQACGKFMIKLRCTGALHHAVSLAAGKKLPLVNIFHFNGKKITVGNASERGFDQEEVTGIKAEDFYVYTLEWTPTQLTWYVNNVEVYSTRANVPSEQLYLALRSFIAESQNAEEGLLEVDWIKVCA